MGTAARILVADHDRVFRERMSRVLERVGYTVQQSENGEEALAAALDQLGGT